MTSTLRVVSFWGGPGCGKSRAASGLTGLMVSSHMAVEPVAEYAKELTFARDWVDLADQAHVTGEQERRQWRLRGQVDWCVTDSPLPIGILYACRPEHGPAYDAHCWELWDRYVNLAVLVDRAWPYQSHGRIQSEAEARALDVRAEELWQLAASRTTTVASLRVRGDDEAPATVLDWLRGLGDFRGLSGACGES